MIFFLQFQCTIQKLKEPKSIASTPFLMDVSSRKFHKTDSVRDIDTAAKFIGAGAATVGVAGSGKFIYL